VTEFGIVIVKLWMSLNVVLHLFVPYCIYLSKLFCIFDVGLLQFVVSSFDCILWSGDFVAASSFDPCH